MLQSLFNNQATQNKSVIPGVTFNRPTGFVDQYGGNGELTGTSNWGSYFSGLDNLGEGYKVEDVQSIGGSNPTGFTINRADPNGNANVYQQRQITVNPDGTLSWANDSNWVSKTQQSQMGHFLEAGLPMALAMAGGIGATGGFGGAAGSTAGASTAGATGAGAAGIADPLAAYMTTGAAEGSTIGGALLGGGGAGAVGTGTAAGTIGSLMNNPVASYLGNKVGGTLAGNLVGKVLGGSGGISPMGNLASLFTNYQQYNKMGDLINEIKSIYKPDGEYAKYLENQLGRRDAAAGRNSQYGPRLAELMGRLGDSQARALSGLGGFMQTQQGGLNGMVGAGGRLLGGLGLDDLLSNGLQGLFSQQGGMNVGDLGSTPGIWDRPDVDVDWEELFGG